MNTGASLAGGIGIMAAGFSKQFLSLGGFFALTSVAFLVAGLLLLATYRFRLATDLHRNENIDIQ
jgi:hypothetical protein